MQIQLIEISKIKINGGTQHREVDKDIRDEYAQLVREEIEMPPVEVVFDGKHYWLWDGFHRLQAHIAAECDCIQANVREGTKRDAVWLSFGANKDHGLRRKAEDVRKIIATIKADPIWGTSKTQVEIASIVGVSERHVRRIIEELDTNIQKPDICPVIGHDESDTEPEDDGDPEPEESRPSPEPTTRDAKPAKDKEGNEIPRKLVDIFLRANELQSRSETLSSVLNDIISLHSTNDPLLRHLQIEAFKVDITNARNALRHSKPHAVCPYCAGEAKGCKACKGSGWVTKIMYDAAPRELK